MEAYKARLRDEYYSIRRKCSSLRRFIKRIQNSQCKIVLKYPHALLLQQLTCMEGYRDTLKMRCEAEGIQLQKSKQEPDNT